MADEAGHITTDKLELYSLLRLPSDEFQEIGKHLSWCRDCNDRMKAIDRFIRLVRTGGVTEPSSRDLSHL